MDKINWRTLQDEIWDADNCEPDDGQFVKAMREFRDTGAIYHYWFKKPWNEPAESEPETWGPSVDQIDFTGLPKRYVQVSIQPASGGFGEYDVLPDTSEPYDSASDLLDAMSENVELFELGVDELPDGMEDIRGRIHNQPERVFGYMEDGQVIYTGIDSI